MDCGPTALRIISQYYGKTFSLQFLREKAFPTREGVSLLAISQGAEELGFETKGYKCEFDALKELKHPLIVHWRQNHFVVLYKIDKKENCYISDPASGLMKYSKMEFLKYFGGSSTNPSEEAQTEHSRSGSDTNTQPVSDLSHQTCGNWSDQENREETSKSGKSFNFYHPKEWCSKFINYFNKAGTTPFRVYSSSDSEEVNQPLGICLTLEPTDKFYSQENVYSSTSFIHIKSYLKPFKRSFIYIVIIMTFLSGVQFLFPFLTQNLVDVGIEGSDLGFVYLILIAQASLVVGRTVLEFLRTRILLKVGIRLNISIVSEFLSKLMRLPISFFDVKMTGDIIQRVGDHERVKSFLTTNTLSILFSLINFFIYGAILLYYNITIFLIFMGGSLLYFWWIFIFLKKRREIDQKSFEIMSENQNFLVQFVTGMQEIKLCGSENDRKEEWERIQKDIFDINIKSLNLSQTQNSGAVLINEMKNVFISGVSAAAVIDGSITLGMMLSIQYIVGQLTAPVSEFINFTLSAQNAKISLERIGEIHDKDDEENQNLKTPQLAEKSISIANLSFRYERSEPYFPLKDINLVIPEGKVTAIVGGSGSGKTTLIKLLLGFYSPEVGAISYGDEDLKGLRISKIRELCGVVMQEGYIFSDTIEKNISPTGKKVDRDRMDLAIKVANIGEYIESLPLGLSTKIGSDGKGLSQGQKQRLLIARAVYKDPHYLFFDEATNALDANNEKIIMENLENFFKNRTAIVVAHRLSTVKNADQIVVLDRGEIVEIGDHKSLTKRRGAYYKLVKNQLELGS